MKSNFQERRQNRLEAFQRLASTNEKLSFTLFERSSEMADCIPFGQPILVGHHSEKRHRAHLAKIDNAMRKSVEADKKAEYYAQRAKAIESGNAISSDDPNCIEKLQTKLAGLEAMQELMKDCNKIIKGKGAEIEKIEKMIEVGLKEKYAVQIMQPDFAGRIGFPSFKLTNNGAKIRSTKQRIEYLTKLSEVKTWEKEINGVILKVNAEDNRVQIFFNSKPSEEVRRQLKRSGFRWAPSVGAWMRLMSGTAVREAKEILNNLAQL